jgi:hypothetical protein
MCSLRASLRRRRRAERKQKKGIYKYETYEKESIVGVRTCCTKAEAKASLLFPNYYFSSIISKKNAFLLSEHVKVDKE